MDIKTNGYPAFWGIVKKGFNKQRVNSELICPMNYVFDIKTNKFIINLIILNPLSFLVNKKRILQSYFNQYQI